MLISLLPTQLPSSWNVSLFVHLCVFASSSVDPLHDFYLCLCPFSSAPEEGWEMDGWERIGLYWVWICLSVWVESILVRSLYVALRLFNLVSCRHFNLLLSLSGLLLFLCICRFFCVWWRYVFVLQVPLLIFFLYVIDVEAVNVACLHLHQCMFASVHVCLSVWICVCCLILCRITVAGYLLMRLLLLRNKNSNFLHMFLPLLQYMFSGRNLLLKQLQFLFLLF